MITKILLGLLGVIGVIFTYLFVKDLMVHKDTLKNEKGNVVTTSLIGFTTNALDTLGIGSFATITASVRLFKQIDDRLIPGTLNVCCTIPVIIEAFLFIKDVGVEPITLTLMLLAATIGSYLGAGVVAKLPTRKIQYAMGIALFLTAGIMLSQKLGFFPAGGNEIGLSGIKLFIAVGANFILGALMTAGIGLYAPCMALVYFLGMSPLVAFPIMMGSSAFLMPVASVKFFKEGAYARKGSLILTLSGIVGVLVGVTFIKSLPMNILSWLVIGVLTYTAITLFHSAAKKKNLDNVICSKA